MADEQYAEEPRRRKRRTDREIVDTLDTQIAELTRRRDAAKAREAERKRKLRARRMIILGSALVKLGAGGAHEPRALVERIIAQASERDRAAFAGWDPWGGDDEESGDER